jgi:Type VI secretion system (T6SS), amidase effector protein 4
MPITFNDLWEAYPTEDSPCSNSNGQAHFDNQCSIRMGICLIDAGVNLASCRAVRCWHGHGRRHILRAQELADWLKGRDGRRVFGTVERQKSPVAYNQYSGKNGIVFCRNFWGPGNQGDHIDLWDGSANVMRTGALDYISRSQEVWFWHIV